MWTKEKKNRTSERVILKDPEFENNKTPRTQISRIESQSDRRRRRRNTINPAGVFQKHDSLLSRQAGNSKINPRKLFTNDIEVNNLNAVRNIFCRSHSKIESNSKRKCRSTKKERQKNLLRLRKSKNCSETSSESCTSIKNSRSNSVSNQMTSQRTRILCGNEYTNIEKIFNENIKQSSFDLQSPKLFLNSNELSPSNRTTDSPGTFTTEDGFEIESSEITSSDDVSFSVLRIKFQNNSYYQHNSDSFKNDGPSTRNDQIYIKPKMQQSKHFSSILPNISESDTTAISDDGRSSIGYSPMDCDESTLAMVNNSSTSDVDVQMDNSKILPAKRRTFIHGNGDNTNHDYVSLHRSFSPNNERSLPFKKRPMPWNTLLDPLESALTTSIEKLNEIKYDL